MISTPYFIFKFKLVAIVILISMENQYVENVESSKQQPPPLRQPPPPLQQQSSSQQEQKLSMPFLENCINCDGKKSIRDNTDVKFPPKCKINKAEKKKRLNARMRRLVCPKNASMVFSELYNNVSIQIQEHKIYTATIEIDGQIHSGNHSSKNKAKQKACENFFRDMLKKKLSEQSEEKSPEDVEIEVGENGSISKPKRPPQENFPWPQFASLAMNNLITLIQTFGEKFECLKILRYNIKKEWSSE
ncbi:hypothetical protein AGLY_008918 [Aphis glycines]|uniref:DRBM domain-containing protein n=1 Tax=Aphis glycines TaxID=307491 RepID=A0A6G0TJN6_APHGL|nr:hypothetical protein AGLY_008918 [Aphis glycines]